MKYKHMQQQGLFARFFFYLGYTFLYIPIFLVIAYSFHASPSMAWEGRFSLHWFKVLAHNALLLDAALVSLKIAVPSATLAVILGTLCAHAWIARNGSSRLLGFLAAMPLVIPEVVIGLSLLILFVAVEPYASWLPRGMVTITIAHTTLGIAYVTAIVRARLTSLSPFLREAALDLGAQPLRVFWSITLPLILPSLIAGWLIAFILSFDDVILASFTSGPGTSTLPMVIFSSLKVGYTPQINALATCIIVLASLIVMITGYIMYQRSDALGKKKEVL